MWRALGGWVWFRSFGILLFLNGNVESNGVSGWSKVWVCTPPKKGGGNRRGIGKKL